MSCTNHLIRHRQTSIMTQSSQSTPTLTILDRTKGHDFQTPKKCINDGDDVTFFLASRAYADIMTFMFQLNTAMIPRKVQSKEQGITSVKEWTLQDPDVPHPPVVQSLAKLLEALTSLIDEAPPDTGPRRFGNVSFRTWYDLVRERATALLDEYLPADVLAYASIPSDASRSRSQRATWQHSTIVAGRPGSRSKTRRSASAGEPTRH